MEDPCLVSYSSALSITVPSDKLKGIQDFREQNHHIYEKWIPHINLMYPFIYTKDGKRLVSDDKYNELRVDIEDEKMKYERTLNLILRNVKIISDEIKKKKGGGKDNTNDADVDVYEYDFPKKQYIKI